MNKLFIVMLLISISFINSKKPNIVFILSDDLGYGDYDGNLPNNSTHGRLYTPNITALRKTGIKFTTSYSGPICAPSRNTLMTGQHMGHTTIRGNDGAYSPLKDSDVTVAQVLKDAGYHTGLVGKWGLGDFGSTGYPTNQGFNEFIGQDNQVDCHDWYPKFIQNNTIAKYNIPQNNVTNYEVCGAKIDKECVWSNDLYRELGVDFIERSSQSEEPFFLYLSSTTPHVGNMKGQSGEYPVPWTYKSQINNSSWPMKEQNFSAAVLGQDAIVGAVMDKLEELKILEDTIVFFSGDNGPQSHDITFFDSVGPFRGEKASVNEGGIRQQIIVSWPGTIEANSTSDHIMTFWDFLPTAAELAGAEVSNLTIDGISAVPALQGKQQTSHSEIYYEFCWDSTFKSWSYGNGWAQAYRNGSYKGIRVDQGEMQLYNLEEDIGEQNDISSQHSDMVELFTKAMDAAHSDNQQWPSTDNNKKHPCCAHCYSAKGCGSNCVAPSYNQIFSK